MPGLDGLRAIAVLAVIAYHLGLGWAPGGLLGVGVFFTLSGYLITDLLLGQWSTGGLRLANFWLRRARRLLPALFVMLVVVMAWVTLAQPSQLADLRGAVWAAAGYFSNWWMIYQHVPYFARFGPPSPLGHLWSLAIEEQFYLFWPWLLLLGLKLVPEPSGPLPIRPRLAGATLALAIASALTMALLYHPGFDTSRVYDGTDTRAFGLLFGAALAMVWPSRSLTTNVTVGARQILDGMGVVGLTAIAILIWRTNDYSSFLYQGGMVLLSVATVMVITALVHPATMLGRALGWRPLRWIGVRSYGIYLWQFPIIVLTTPAPYRGVDALRAILQVGASFTLAALSWRFVEEPIRHGALGRLWARVRSRRWRPRPLPLRGWAALAATAFVLVLASLGLAGVAPPTHFSSLAASISVGTGAAELPPSSASGGPAGGSSVPDPVGASSARTSCRAVAYIGDSTSEGMISTDYLPRRADRLSARLAGVGATRQHLEITGATSIVETLPGGTNAYEVARQLVSDGFDGCWVLALGTNDTADVYVGSSVDVDTRIQRMMSAIGDQPVMWVTAKSLLAGGPYSEGNMERWNGALLDACSRYSNMKVYDWASAARDGWFIPDGIHYTSEGYAARARLTADALAAAFPASGTPSAGCVVS
ncbi:MAG TPA: acyltransferase family protein [Solirubrobacterales bacterium]|jgi:peptidoglycan/LPS O-acetylase OafA/YrhL